MLTFWPKGNKARTNIPESPKDPDFFSLGRCGTAVGHHPRCNLELVEWDRERLGNNFEALDTWYARFKTLYRCRYCGTEIIVSVISYL